MTARTPATGRDVGAEGPFLARALKAPTLRQSVRPAERARAEAWSHEKFLASCLQREVSARESQAGVRDPGSEAPSP